MKIIDQLFGNWKEREVEIFWRWFMKRKMMIWNRRQNILDISLSPNLSFLSIKFTQTVPCPAGAWIRFEFFWNFWTIKFWPIFTYYFGYHHLSKSMLRIKNRCEEQKLKPGNRQYFIKRIDGDEWKCGWIKEYIWFKGFILCRWIWLNYDQILYFLNLKSSHLKQYEIMFTF
jgi:hypothetical protein